MGRKPSRCASHPNAAPAGRTGGASAASAGTRGVGCEPQFPLPVERTVFRLPLSSYGLKSNSYVLPRCNSKQLGRIPAADRERDVPVGVLVKDHIALAGVRERPRDNGVVAVEPELHLDHRAG